MPACEMLDRNRIELYAAAGQEIMRLYDETQLISTGTLLLELNDSRKVAFAVQAATLLKLIS